MVECVPLISLFVYLVLFVLKKAMGENEIFNRFIPLIALVLGCFLGGMTNLVEEGDLVSRVIVGGVSGLASTGGDQIIKQLFGK